MRGMSTSLEIHVRSVDGSVNSYAQHDPDKIGALIQGIAPHRMFEQPYFCIDSRESVTVHPIPQVACVEIVMDYDPGWKFNDSFEIRRVDEAIFDNEYRPDRNPQIRPSHWKVGEDFEGFWRFKLTGGWMIHVRLATKVAHVFDQRHAIANILRAKCLFMQGQNGAYSFINPVHIVQAEAFPGQPEIATGGWSAEPL